MYKWATGIIIPVLILALIGTGYFGYQENREKNSILIKAENQYQRAFHDLNFHIDALHNELGKTLAVNSRKQITPCLANVWRLAYAAQADVGQLPLVLLPFSKTEEFLANIADFSYRISIRDLDKDPLNDNEYKTLKNLYQNSSEIKKELDNVQDKVLENNLRWMDVELALSLEDKKMDNTIIDGFKTINKRVEEFSEIDWGPGINSLDKKTSEDEKNLKGKPITAKEAKKKAAEFLGIKETDKIEVFDDGKGLEYRAYSATIEENDNIYMDITRVGGHVAWMMINREVEDKKISIREANDKAEAFLKKHQYKSMVPIEYRDYDNSIIIIYAYKQDEVIVYSDVISVKVALDNGQITGFQPIDYLFSHKERKIPAPKLTEEQAKKNVNPNLAVSSIRLALIKSYDKKEVLTYEVAGSMGNSYYRIYINADNGDEEEIQKVEKQDITIG